MFLKIAIVIVHHERMEAQFVTTPLVIAVTCASLLSAHIGDGEGAAVGGTGVLADDESPPTELPGRSTYMHPLSPMPHLAQYEAVCSLHSTEDLTKHAGS